jgi:hypothetical protein
LTVGIDGAAFGNEHAEVVIDLVPDTRVRTTGGNFADDDGTLQHFQIVGELPRAGNGGGRGEDVNRLMASLLPGTYFSSFTRVLPSVGHDANDHNLLLKRRPFIMRQHKLAMKLRVSGHRCIPCSSALSG